MSKTMQVSLEEYIKANGYTIEEWKKCADELVDKGVAKGCFNDYNLLALVMGWLFNYRSIINVESE